MGLVLALFATAVHAATPVTPDASSEARALLNYIHAMYGKKTLSGQMWAPWSGYEIDTVCSMTIILHFSDN